MQPWLVTGAAGFIGFHVCRRLLADGQPVVGIDNVNDYYDPALKKSRLEELARDPGWEFRQVDLADRAGVAKAFEDWRPDIVVNLAAQAGVRYSLQQPMAYIESNIVGFMHVLEECRRWQPRHLVYASSSSVYGETARLPFSVHDPADHPVSLYAATKRANELMAHSYSHLYGVPTTGLRFFTVYGPWGRPDMAYFSFTDAIVRGRPITVFGDGTALRDFTYIDDIVEGIIRAAAKPATPNPDWTPEAPDLGTSRAPWQIFNIGHGERVTVNRLIALLSEQLGLPANRITGPPQPGDVPVTHADVSDLNDYVQFTPQVPLEKGLAAFIAWYKNYFLPGERT